MSASIMKRGRIVASPVRTTNSASASIMKQGRVVAGISSSLAARSPSVSIDHETGKGCRPSEGAVTPRFSRIGIDQRAEKSCRWTCSNPDPKLGVRIDQMLRKSCRFSSWLFSRSESIGCAGRVVARANQDQRNATSSVRIDRMLRKGCRFSALLLLCSTAMSESIGCSGRVVATERDPGICYAWKSCRPDTRMPRGRVVAENCRGKSQTGVELMQKGNASDPTETTETAGTTASLLPVQARNRRR